MGQNAPRTIQQFTPLINKYAYKFHQRAMGLGCAMDMDDIRQELCIIFLRCVTNYDETKGASFMNFLISAMYHEMNRMMQRDQRNFEQARTVRQFQMDDEGEETDSLFDRIDSGWASPEQNLEAMQSFDALLESLSPQARLLVQNVVDPSPEVCRQFELQERGSRRLREVGEDARAMLQLNLNFLFHLFQIPRDTAVKLKQEIKAKTGSAFLLGVQ